MLPIEIAINENQFFGLISLYKDDLIGKYWKSMRSEVMLYYLFEIVARKKRVSDGELAINISRCKKG